MLSNIPEELIFNVFWFSDIHSLQSLSGTCVSFRRILESKHFCNKYAFYHLCSNFDFAVERVELLQILNAQSLMQSIECGFDKILSNRIKQHLSNSNKQVPKCLLYAGAIRYSRDCCFKILLNSFGLDSTIVENVIQTILMHDQLTIFTIVYQYLNQSHYPFIIDSLKYYNDLKIFKWLFENEFFKFASSVKPLVYTAIRKDNDKALKFIIEKGYTIKLYLYEYADFIMMDYCPRIFTFLLKSNDFDYDFEWGKEDGKNLYHVLFQTYPLLISDLLPIIQKQSTPFRHHLNINKIDNTGKRPIEYFFQRLAQNHQLCDNLQLLINNENLDFANAKIPASDIIIPYLVPLRKKGWFPSFQNLNESIKNNIPSLSRQLFGMMVNLFFSQNLSLVPLFLNTSTVVNNNDLILEFFLVFEERRHWNQHFIHHVLTWLRWGHSQPYVDLTKQFLRIGQSQFAENETFRVQAILSMIRVNFESIFSVINKTFVSQSMIQPIVNVLSHEVRPRALLAFCKLAEINLASLVSNDIRKTRLSFFVDALILKWTGGKRKRCQTNDKSFQQIWNTFMTFVKSSDTKSMALYIKEHPDIFNKQRLSVVEFRNYKQLCDDLFALDSHESN